MSSNELQLRKLWCLC